MLRKKQFGVSSEQVKAQLDGQLSLLFNETEAHAASPGLQKATHVVPHIRKKSGRCIPRAACSAISSIRSAPPPALSVGRTSSRWWLT